MTPKKKSNIMKLASFNDHRIGIIDGEAIVDITAIVGVTAGAWPPVGMVQVIADFDRLAPKIAAGLAGAPRLALRDVVLQTPVAWPNKVIAYPANFHAHIAEMGEGLISTYKASGQGFFLKSNSSLSGPADPIILPDVAGREIHHECEMAIIIGKGGRDIAPEEALSHVFGYSCLLDIVIRGKEERVMRKAFDTFCPVGPYITTIDEAPAHDQIEMELTVNNVTKQKVNTSHLIVDIPNMIAMASSVMTLQPGDIIASGTPAGVGPIAAGDKLRINVSGVGEMEIDVVQGRAGNHPVWHYKD